MPDYSGTTVARPEAGAIGHCPSAPTALCAPAFLPHAEDDLGHSARVPTEMEELIALFIRDERGSQVRALFARRAGVSESTICRLEHCQQALKVRLMDGILKNLHRTWDDILTFREAPALALVRERPVRYGLPGPQRVPATVAGKSAKSSPAAATKPSRHAP